jgi:pSer/pThr/pTyr-binding forkhead associated (FHA) protein
LAEKEERDYLIRYPGEPLLLEHGRTYVLGRAGDCDVVLGDPNVSRRHCEIAWDGSGFVLRDLGSRNGTRINDEPVPEKRLASGDRITLGQRTLQYLSVAEDAVERLSSGSRAQVQAQVTQSFSLADVFAGRALAGLLSDFPVPEIVQTIGATGKTGVLVVDTPDGSGRLQAEGGRIVAAEYRDLAGEEAFFAMLPLQEGRFDFRAEERALAPSIRTETAMLLLEGLRRADEAAREEAPEGGEEAPAD